MESRSKLTFKFIFFVLSVLLVILPFLTTFSEQLTGVMQNTPLYVFIQNYIVPYEVKIVGLVLSLLKIPAAVSNTSLSVNGQPLEVTWNCLGWQSMLFLLSSMFFGMQGGFSLSSKLQTLGIGMLGTFWVNILRITLLSILGGYFPTIFAVIFHEYFATFVTVVWLFFFWWFSYSFVLEEKQGKEASEIAG